MRIIEAADRISAGFRILSIIAATAFIGWVVYMATAPSRMAEGLLEIEQNAVITAEGIMQQQREIVRDVELAEDGWGTTHERVERISSRRREPKPSDFAEPIDDPSGRRNSPEGGGWGVD